MGRAPCCEKMGLKKGPWTKEEDLVLVTYINQHGHQNWRALPKKAGLLRCGKSCRLRWINYLRPDIKRGNFSKEEEDTIIHLHQVLGNRWSAIAAKLPGRTDNEIKNVWHTHLKKRLLHHHAAKSDRGCTGTEDDDSTSTVSLPESSGSRSQCQPNSPSHSTSSLSSSATTDPEKKSGDARLDVEDFSWLDGVVSSENSGKFTDEECGLFLPVLSPLRGVNYSSSSSFSDTSLQGDMDFWSDLFTRADESLHLPEF